MDFTFTAEHEALRGELRAFLADALPGDLGLTGQIDTRNWDGQMAFLRQLAERNWVAPAWPREYGGLGWAPISQMIFAEEMSYFGAPDVGRVFSVGMIGPTLIVHGSEEQKAQHLPPITRGEAIWCQGYSEPGAGSDLAALQTRADRDGDDYIINGQKIWTTGAHNADWMFILTRTDQEAPKHRGISFFLLDMKTPGITVRPIHNMRNAHDFNEVFFENVRVPAVNRVGEENRGWYVGMTLLDFERSSVASIAQNHRVLDRLREALRPLPATSLTRYELADHWIANETGRLLSYRIGWMQEAGTVPNYEASVVKVFATEVAQRILNTGVNALGLGGQLRDDAPGAPIGGAIPEAFLEAVAPTIYSGSNEIQRNIIAQRGLGLPRD